MENSEAFEPYNPFHPLDAQATGLTLSEMNEGVSNGWCTGWPIDGDAQAREDATALKANLHAILAGPKLSGTAWVEALPDLTRWQGDVLNAAAVALPQGARMTTSPRRKQ